MSSTISIGQHLINRLKEINIDVVFGVPGDFNMPLLDIIEDDPELTWGNNANELNASYAADGYARIRGAGAVVTTFGVGELSAVNGIAGSYSEMLPVIHIVGTPSTKSQAAGAMLHHSLGDGNFDVFFQMSSMITCASTHLKAQNAIAEIDRVISQAVLSKRTGYIGIPIDLIHHEVQVPELPPLTITLPKNPAQTQEIALKVVLDAIHKASHPVIVVDGCVLRNRCEKSVQEFIQRSGFPTYVAPMGKGAVDESLASYRGCYSGNITLESIDKEIHQADLIIEIGSIKSDFNTGNFSYSLNRSKTITLHSFATIVFCAEYQKVSMMEFIPLLTEALPKEPRVFELGPRGKPEPIKEGTDEITHNYFWNKVPEFMDENAIVCAETGTAEFASLNMDGPKGTTYITQILWGSIGFSVGAAVGAAMADRQRRVYLFVGDGSFQLTAQEISVFLRHGLTPVVFLLNNDGYLIEKLIHGPDRSYNNFQMWEYNKALDFFGANIQRNQELGCSKVGFQGKVATRDEFESAMKDVQANPNKIHFLEVVMPQFDAPRELELLVASSENR
ncbi:pyruvate decarboxylase PdcB [Pilaira anomala]|nr:pyruvate decarboxylase PdcB [Pilaira anomala]